jgi:hypothetical protein
LLPLSSGQKSKSRELKIASIWRKKDQGNELDDRKHWARSAYSSTLQKQAADSSETKHKD